MLKVEEKLFQDRYRVDSGRPHIQIKNPEICTHKCTEQQCTVCCPAGRNGKVVLISDGCLECGTCRIICDEHRNLEWEWPRGGFGILFKFG